MTELRTLARRATAAGALAAAFLALSAAPAATNRGAVRPPRRRAHRRTPPRPFSQSAALLARDGTRDEVPQVRVGAV